MARPVIVSAGRCRNFSPTLTTEGSALGPTSRFGRAQIGSTPNMPRYFSMTRLSFECTAERSHRDQAVALPGISFLAKLAVLSQELHRLGRATRKGARLALSPFTSSPIHGT